MIYLFAKNGKAYAKLFDDDPGERERVENCGAFDESEFDRTLYTFNGDVDEFEAFHKGLQRVDIKITDDFYNAVYDSLDYERLKNNIDMEWIFPAKAMLSLHKDSFTSADYEQMKQKFKTVAETLGFAVIKETWLNQYPTTIDEYLETLS